MHQGLFRVFAIATLLCLGACQGYDVKINDKVVYTPPSLFSDYSVADDALRTCIDQVIIDENIVAPEQLTALNCAHAGIIRLDGLSTFSGLKSLKLSHNRIRNLVEVAQLPRLHTLILDDNLVVDPVPLEAMPNLEKLDLSDNPGLQCPRAGSLGGISDITLPSHCR